MGAARAARAAGRNQARRTGATLALVAGLALVVGASGCSSFEIVRGEEGLSGVSSGRYLQVAMGQLFTCALREDGAADCWGDDSGGIQRPAAGPFTRIAASAYGACGLRRDGSVGCWGRRFYSTAAVEAPPGEYTGVAGGRTGFCGLRRDGAIWCWGDASFGFGLSPSGVGYRSVHVGGANVCVLRTDGCIDCVGADVPGPLAPPAGEFAAMAMGWHLACGIRTDGTLACWGLGDEDEVWQQRSPPGELDARAVREYAALAAVRPLQAAQATAAAAHASGDAVKSAQAKGAIIGGALIAAGVPNGLAIWAVREGRVLHKTPSGRFRQVSVGALGELCALDEAGEVLCWGALERRPDDPPNDLPPPPGPFVAVTAGSSAACGVREDGRIGCWGVGYRGSLHPPGSPARAR